MHPAVKVLMMIPSLASMWVGLSPPRPPPAKDEVKLSYRAVFDFCRDFLIFLCKLFIGSYMLCESILLITLYYRTPSTPHIVSALCPNNHTPSYADLSTPSPIFTAGAALTLAGCAVRVWCYRTLGDLFNFVVHISDNHRLVTSGPYAYVRHPSYTGVAMILGGIAMMCMAPVDYLNQCSLLNTRAWGFIRFWHCGASFTVISLFRRGGPEDDLLRKTFGEDWERYREAVPRKFIPYIW